MRLGEVMDEVAAAVKTITGLQEVYPYPPPTLTAPSGYVVYPESVNYDGAYGRGEDQFTDLGIVLAVGKPTEISARDTVAAWASGDGPHSIKRALEAWSWTTCDDLTVTSCEFITDTVADVPYLAAMFKATVVGSGKDQD